MKTVIVVLALLGSSAAWAEEPVGCDKFQWSIDQARSALNAPDLPKLMSGADLTGPAAHLNLRPNNEANLPSPPERAPKAGTFAGFATIPAVAKGGSYTVNLSAGAWLDVVQNGAFLKPVAFSGATGCDGIRKTVKFELKPGSVIIQISGASADSLALAVLPATE